MTISRTSLAAVFSGEPCVLKMQQLDVPEPSGAEILVRIECCTLCGSDLHSYEGRRRVPVPTILGHEITGRIAEFGPKAARTDALGQSLQIGSRIVWGLVASCGECFYCRRDLPQKCLHAVKYGHEAFRSGHELRGGLAEFCLLAAGTTIAAIPDHLSDARITPAGCATSTIAAAIECAGELNQRVVCIAGAGLLGLTACAMARSRGAESVIVCDINSDRREQAMEFGATHSCPPEQFQELVSNCTGGFGADTALELSGAPAAFRMLLPALRLGGSLVLVGAVFPADPIELAMEQIVRRNLTIHGVHNYAPRHLCQAVQFLVQDGSRYPFDQLVSQWFSLGDAGQALAAAMNPRCIRVGIRPNS